MMKTNNKPIFLFMLLLILNACQPNPDVDKNTTDQQKGCTKELMICPDGQTVSRNPDRSCEFDPCPEPISANECQDDMKQCPDGTFVKRDVDKNCQFKPCPKETKPKDAVVYCTQEVAFCDDGSYVSRDPENNCAFEPCPDGSTPKRSKSSIE